MAGHEARPGKRLEMKAHVTCKEQSPDGKPCEELVLDAENHGDKMILGHIASTLRKFYRIKAPHDLAVEKLTIELR